MSRAEKTPPIISEAIKDDIKVRIDKMKRAITASEKAYPKDRYTEDLRTAYSNGYIQAEEDLALTWQDIKQIVNLADETLKANTGFESEQAYYEEVLRLFNNNNNKSL